MHGEEKAELAVDLADLGVFVLKTPWVEGVHHPTSIDQMVSLCDELAALHKQNMMHGDALCQNIIFHDQEATLIDFDYSHLWSYPAHWNTAFMERHPTSKGGARLKCNHDVCAAIAIWCHYFELDGGVIHKVFAEKDLPFTRESHPHLNEDWSSASAEELKKWITKQKEKLKLRAQDFAAETDGPHLLVVQTGPAPEVKKKRA